MNIGACCWDRLVTFGQDHGYDEIGNHGSDGYNMFACWQVTFQPTPM